MPEDPELRRRLAGPWVPRGTLFLPPGLPQRHGDIDNIRTYVKYSELAGVEPTLDDFIARLREVGLRSLLLSLSRLITVLHIDGVSRLDLQAVLRQEAFTPRMLAHLRQLQDWEERIVFFQQQILFTAKMATLYATDRDDARQDLEFRDVVVELLLMAGDFFDRFDLSADPSELERALVAHHVRSYLLNTTEQLRYLIAGLAPLPEAALRTRTPWRSRLPGPPGHLPGRKWLRPEELPSVRPRNHRLVHRAELSPRDAQP